MAQCSRFNWIFKHFVKFINFCQIPHHCYYILTTEDIEQFLKYMKQIYGNGRGSTRKLFQICVIPMKLDLDTHKTIFLNNSRKYPIQWYNIPISFHPSDRILFKNVICNNTPIQQNTFLKFWDIIVSTLVLNIY